MYEIGKPILYCSSDFETAIKEIQPEIGDYVTLMRYAKRKNTPPFRVMELGVHELEWDPNVNTYQQDLVQLRSLCKDDDEFKSILKIHSFLKEEFTKQEKNR